VSGKYIAIVKLKMSQIILTILEQSVPFTLVFNNKTKQFQRLKVLLKRTHQFKYPNEQARENQKRK
jgi:hypothetical protein